MNVITMKVRIPTNKTLRCHFNDIDSVCIFEKRLRDSVPDIETDLKVDTIKESPQLEKELLRDPKRYADHILYTYFGKDVFIKGFQKVEVEF